MKFTDSPFGAVTLVAIAVFIIMFWPIALIIGWINPPYDEGYMDTVSDRYHW